MKKPAFSRLHTIRILLSLLLTLPLLLNALDMLQLGFVARLENYAYDRRLQLTTPDRLYANRDRPIVFVDIDEKSLQEQGHWPWPRNKLAPPRRWASTRCASTRR